jgi:hypothetical protein
MTIDKATLYRWQTAAHPILGELIAKGQKAGLPPLNWTLATTGALVGEAPGLHGDPDQRTSLTQWAQLLGTTVTETQREDGRISLHAPLTRDGERLGALRAEIFPEYDDPS